MNSRAIGDAELRTMSETERDAAWSELLSATRAPAGSQLEAIDARVREFESVFGMSSETMRARLANGSLQETDAVCRWLMILAVRDRIAAHASRSR
jgi:hypothetical protein